mgnify:CR=1 FL=1|jgi:hypothetical protein
MLLIQRNKPKLSSVGCVNQQARSIGLKLRLMILFTTLIFVSSCSEFALLMSGSSIAISQNAYVKAYNGADVLTIMYSEKSIKKHIYDKGKEHVQTLTRIAND